MKLFYSTLFILIGFLQLNSQTYQWANKFGDAAEQISTRTYVDQVNGRVYNTGYIKGTVDFDPGTGTTNLTSGTGYNGYLACYTNAGALVWAKLFESATGESYVNGIVTDASSNVYICGAIKGTVDMDLGAGTDNKNVGNTKEGFLMKLNSSGTQQWYQLVGGGGHEQMNDIALNSTNQIYVIGSSNANSFDVDPGTATVTITNTGPSCCGGATDADYFSYLVKFDNNGNYLNHGLMMIGTNGNSDIILNAARLKVNSLGEVLVVASYSYAENSSPWTHYIKTKFYKFDASCVSIAVRDLYSDLGTGNYGECYPTDLEFDTNGDYYILGKFTRKLQAGANMTLTPGNTTVLNGFLVKYNSGGTAQWAKLLNGNCLPAAMSRDASGNFDITGTFAGTVDFNPSTTINNYTSLGSKDGFIVQLDNTGAFTGNFIRIGGSGDEYVNDIGIVNSNGDFYLGGNFQSANVDFNPATATNTLSAAGSSDIFLAKYSTCSMPTSPLNTTPTNNLNICSGSSVTLSVNNQTGASFTWYTNPTAGLSFASGLTANVSPSATTSYYVQAANSCGTSTRTEIIVQVSGSSVTPTISASTTSPSTICQGTSVTFSSAQTNGGTPTYQWNLNGSPVSGATSATFTTTTLPAGTNTVTCTMNSTAACASPTSVNSNSVIITVSPLLTPAASITASQTAICNGTPVSFTATPTNGGTSPTYQWMVNGTNQGAPSTSNTFSSSTLANNAQVSCILTSNATCASSVTANSNTIAVTVNPNVTPSASITASQTTICTGTNVSFTVTPTNGGTSPTYQWKLNGSNIGGATSSTYSSSSLTNGANITCVVTSNATCASPTTATSNAVVMNVVSSVTPSATVSSSQTTICPGTTVNFTVTPVNGGTSPTYQWKLNGSNIGGATSSTYSSSSLANGASITCVITSNNACASPTTATSNAVVITVSGSVTPSVIASAISTNICQGDTLELTAIPTNGGTTPIYQWKKNNVNIGGATAATYSTSTVANGDVFNCVMTSSDGCASPTTGTSNNLTVVVTNSVVPTVSISTPANTICSGVSVTFGATATNEGTSPVYQWTLNGNNVGTNSPSYTNSNINNGDVIACSVTSNATCAIPTIANSNNVTMTVNNSNAPTIIVNALQNHICDIDTMHFISSTTSEGSSPSYQWFVNGNPVIGEVNATFDTLGLTDGDVIACMLTSSLSCAIPTNVTSTNYTASILSTNANTVSINASQDSICMGSAVTINANISGTGSSTTYQWYINGSPINGATTSTYSSYTLEHNDIIYCMISSVSSCGAIVDDTSNYVTMVVGNAGEMTSIYISTANNSICSTDTIIFSASAYNTGNYPQYNWLVNGNPTGVDSIEFVIGGLTNGDIIECTVTSSDGCLSNMIATSSPITIGVTQTVVPNIALTVNDSVICAGETVTFNTTYTNEGSAPIFAWYLLNGSQNFLTAGVNTYTTSTLNNNDTIVAVLVNDDHCAIPNFDVSSISVSVGPDTSVTNVSGTLTANLSGATYQWLDCNNGNSIIAGETNQTFTPSNNGSYAVIVDPGSCPDTSSCYVFNNIGLQHSQKLNSIVVYPNPNNGTFKINTLDIGAYEIRNVLGEIVYSFETDKKSEIRISLNDLTDGVYFLTGKGINEKIIIQK